MPFKSLKLDPTAKLYVKRYYETGMLLLHTDKFIKNLYISSEKHEYVKLSDNYFDMIANKTYKVWLDREQKGTKSIFEALRFRSYIQIHTKEKLQIIFEWFYDYLNLCIAIRQQLHILCNNNKK